MMTDLTGKSRDFIHGYHTAMVEMAKIAQESVVTAQNIRERSASKPSIITAASPTNVKIAEGRIRAASEIGIMALNKADDAKAAANADHLTIARAHFERRPSGGVFSSRPRRNNMR